MNTIKYPKRYSEFEVQSDLYERLLLKGFNVRGCVKSKCKDGDRRAKVYFDIVVFDDKNKAVAIIECKNHQIVDRSELGGRQGRRYGLFNLPLIVCWNMDYVGTSISEVERMFTARKNHEVCNPDFQSLVNEK